MCQLCGERRQDVAVHYACGGGVVCDLLCRECARVVEETCFVVFVGKEPIK